jgi:hypothetical protein
MGQLVYNTSTTVDFEDRVLAHLQLVIGAKFRRNESFFFTWRDSSQTGNGRTMLWMHPTIPITYRFFGGRQPAINRAWVEALMLTANSAGGLQLVPEPQDAGQ